MRVRYSLILCLILLLGACSVPTEPLAGAPTAAPPPPSEPVGAAPTVAAPQSAPTVPAGQVQQRLVEGNSAFALELYQAVRTAPGNLFFSPHSISTALAMLYAGARGRTEEEMAEVLHYDLPQSQLHAAIGALNQELREAAPPQAGADDGGFQLNVANGLWGQQDYPFRAEFVELIAAHYGAELQRVDFRDGTEREQARQAINDWVSRETEGKIEDLLQPGDLDQDTRLVLANAIYFLAHWEVPFLEGTEEGEFHLLDGKGVPVPLMSRRADTPFFEGDDYEAVDVLYEGGRMAMLVLLPAEGRFEAVEASLDAGGIETILASLENNDVQLLLPKFDFEAELDLGSTLQALGMRSAFEPGGADLSGIDGSKQLYVSKAVHKAYVAVDEMGTEAAAATGVVVGVVSMPRLVRVDRPFIFVIHDRETGAILFMGRVLDPRGG